MGWSIAGIPSLRGPPEVISAYATEWREKSVRGHSPRQDAGLARAALVAAKSPSATSAKPGALRRAIFLAQRARSIARHDDPGTGAAQFKTPQISVMSAGARSQRARPPPRTGTAKIKPRRSRPEAAAPDRPVRPERRSAPEPPSEPGAGARPARGRANGAGAPWQLLWRLRLLGQDLAEPSGHQSEHGPHHERDRNDDQRVPEARGGERIHGQRVRHEHVGEGARVP